MRNKQLRWLMMVAVAVVSLASASSALADPYSPSVADIQALTDQTSGFHGGQQLSTIDAIHQAPNGIHLDVTWRVGQNADPFAPNFGQTFARVSLQGFYAAPGLDLSQYMGVKWCVMSDHSSFVQPFVQTGDNFTFWEPSNGGNGIGANDPMSMSTIDFMNARNFSGINPPNIVTNTNMVRAYGLQLGGPGGLVVGEPVKGHIWITKWDVPEPSTVLLLVAGAVGLASAARRRQG